MKRLGRWATRRPWSALGLWLILTAALISQAPSFDARLAPSQLTVPGTSSAEAQRVAKRYFGNQTTIPVLLEGSSAAMNRAGRQLAYALRGDDDLRVLSPWDDGVAIPELRPKPDAALILVVAKTGKGFISEQGQEIRRTADRIVPSDVHVAVSGFSTISADIKDASLDAVHAAEVIAVPILLIVLLLVFRSPIAALIPPVFGAATVGAGYGAVGLVSLWHPITDVATALTSMMGLALGVDYSLLLVSRYREELAHGRTPEGAARLALESAGRTVVLAGATLVVAMFAAIALSPGDYLASAAASVLVVAILGVVGAFIAVPPVLLLLGGRINAWRIGGEPREAGAWARLAGIVQRRPIVTGALALLPLLALLTPTFGLRTGPPDVGTLPESSRVRQDSEQIARVLGAGWSSPFEVYVSNPYGPVTTAARLRAMRSWQQRVARWPGVDVVIGPGQIASREPALLNADRAATRTARTLRRSRQGARKLSRGLGRADQGVDQLRSGLQQAQAASQQLSSGAQTGSDASTRIATALADARGGAEQLAGALDQARDGAGRLASGSGQLHSGAGRLAAALQTAARGTGRITRGGRRLATGLTSGADQLGKLQQPATDATGQANDLLRALGSMTVGRADPQYATALENAGKLSAFLTGRDPRNGTQLDPNYPGLAATVQQGSGQLTSAASGARRLAAGAARLERGLTRLHTGAQRLTDGLARLDRGAVRLRDGLAQIASRSTQLPAGLQRLSAGADELAGGLARLQQGNQQVATGLGNGASRTQQLQSGLANAQAKTRAAARPTGTLNRLKDARNRSPRLLDSGYFVLAALEGSRTGARTQAAYGVNLDSGGQAARITIVADSGPNQAATTRLRNRLAAAMPELARDTNAQTNLGGPGAQIVDYEDALGSRLPLLAVVLSVVSALVLIALLRAPVLALISIALNLLTVGASFGVIALLFTGDPPALGGPGWADILSLLSMFTIMFALSLDYQIFIVTRMYEAWRERGDLAYAITYAIDRTGRVVTGAALIMAAVFIAFSTADLTIIRQTGIGLAVAVIIDSTLIRMVLLPAAMTLAGRWTFWLPEWLDRRLPEFSIEGDPASEPPRA